MLTATKPFDLTTHNGIITMRSLRTGEHRTFRVWTQKEKAKFKPGCRLVGLLVGPDNESDYRSFGQLVGGSIRLWRKHETESFYRWVSQALMHPEAYMDRVEFSFDGRCRKCDKFLSDPKSVLLGIGPTCRGEQ